MITFGELIEFAREFDARAQTKHSLEFYESTIRAGVMDVWGSTNWPFHIATGADEGVVKLVPQFEAGTVAVTANNASITFSSSATAHADWQPTVWNYPARILLGPNQEPYFLNSISGSVGQIDTTYNGTTSGTSQYQIGFWSYDLPDDFQSFDSISRHHWFWDLQAISYHEIYELIAEGFWNGIVDKYAVLPSDGQQKNRLLIWPPPSEKELLRFPYRRQVSWFRYYETGNATVTHSATTVTVAGSSFGTLGYSVAGMVLEIPGTARGYKHVVSSFSGTTLSLSGSWQGPAASGQSYRLSSRIRMPDYMMSTLQYMAQMKASESKRDWQSVTAFKSMMDNAMLIAMGAAWPVGQGFCIEAAGTQSLRETTDYVPPRMIVRNQ